jgi:hypothetical protein
VNAPWTAPFRYPPWQPQLPDGAVKDLAVVSVIRLSVLEGDGSEAKPYRHVAYWVDTRDGSLIFRDDPAERSAGKGES